MYVASVHILSLNQLSFLLPSEIDADASAHVGGPDDVVNDDDEDVDVDNDDDDADVDDVDVDDVDVDDTDVDDDSDVEDSDSLDVLIEDSDLLDVLMEDSDVDETLLSDPIATVIVTVNSALIVHESVPGNSILILSLSSPSITNLGHRKTPSALFTAAWKTRFST